MIMAENKKFGVLLDKVDEKLVDKTLKALKLDAAATLPEKVGQLVGHYRGTAPDVKQLAKCDCGGVFPADMKQCPYCGDEDDADAAKKPAAKAPPAPKVDATKPEAKPDAKPVDTKAPKATAIVKVAAQPDNLAGLTSKSLDEATARVIALKGESTSKMWELGKALQDIHERQLWKLRTDDKGKPTYRSFDAYCAAEVMMSAVSCYALIKIPEHFSAEQVRELGTSKINLILKAPEEDRKALEEDVRKGGISKEELRRKVKGLVDKKGKPAAKAPKVARGGAPPVSKGRPSKSENITILSVLGKKTLPGYLKPTKKDDPMVAVLCPKHVSEWLAKTQPVFFDDLSNGVREVFILTTNSKNELQIRIDRKRFEPTE
jgi:hypothetical protein